MIKKIQAYVSMDERRGVHYYRMFEIIDKLPELGDVFHLDTVAEINEVMLDCEQGNDDVYDYDYYNIITRDKDEEEENYYVAVKKKES